MSTKTFQLAVSQKKKNNYLKMDRVTRCAKIYLSCNTKMEFFTINGCQGVRVKITDIESRRYITLWDDEVYRLMRQIVEYEAVEERHPSTLREFLCHTFSIRPLLDSSKYILLTKYHKRIILDKQCIATLISMNHFFNDFIDSITPSTVYDMEYKVMFRE